MNALFSLSTIPMLETLLLNQMFKYYGRPSKFTRYGAYTLTLPSNEEYSISQLKMLLREIEDGIDRKLSLDE